MYAQAKKTTNAINISQKKQTVSNRTGGGVIWCNPPYGREIAGWVEKCSKHKGVAVMLVPARTDTKWWQDYIYRNPNAQVRFFRGRLKFGDSNNSAPFPSALVIFCNLTLGNC